LNSCSSYGTLGDEECIIAFSSSQSAQDIMILEGVKLAFIGMTTVLLFPALMILLMQWVSVLTRGSANRELEAIRLAKELKLRGRKKQP
jgi:Na+-transporting methylmalonyl-CoA/oxaloacetate decarboxylase gamma subunit